MRDASLLREICMEEGISSPCPDCGKPIAVDRPGDIVFEEMRCPFCGTLLILKYDELVEEGEETSLWWFETSTH